MRFSLVESTEVIVYCNMKSVGGSELKAYKNFLLFTSRKRVCGSFLVIFFTLLVLIKYSYGAGIQDMRLIHANSKLADEQMSQNLTPGILQSHDSVVRN